MNGLPDALSPVLFAAMQAGALVAVFVCGLFALFARRPRLAGLIVLAGGSAWVLAKFVKRVVERGRPEGLVPDVIIRGAEQMGQGFPSGHAAVAAAMATVASPYLSTRGRVVVWLIVALVALARVYTGAHLPFDVIAGFFVGWITGSAIDLITGGWAVARPQAGRIGVDWRPGE
jgi:membrane-associated phospholipid phosphatase